MRKKSVRRRRKRQQQKWVVRETNNPDDRSIDQPIDQEDEAAEP